ncbi:MarR family winged helix-turn-helix transcriptional regulator [Chitinasiproducens palmae]|uniref:DNA-binding transcriptional regulator, MarR family n=1 Tax=Chitinasiproducens palmae TaxID=1770053 RepID=A0A1H2PNF6_9BURK|nr:MarR family transcriptional regulator [Chitinasiproducens palmae]SDV48181.1 DNA-binding transcriptional regulator, MarR family [Chitinasiproducens palmae]
MRQFGRTYRTFLAAFEAAVGLPMQRWRVLLSLHQRDEAISQKQLAEHLQIDPGALTRQLKHLQAMGWIERAVDARDNRITNVSLSSAGRAAVDDALPRRNAFLETVTVALPDDMLNVLSTALGLFETQLREQVAVRPTV